MLQIYQPTKEEKQEDVTLVKESKEDMMKEYEKATLRLDKAHLVCSLVFKSFHCCFRLFFPKSHVRRYMDDIGLI